MGPPVIHRLSEGTLRPIDLTRRLPGISKKMLIQTLRNLERWGLVRQKVYPVVPPHVEYSLTRRGARFIEPIALLGKWADANEADPRKMTKLRSARPLIDPKQDSVPRSTSRPRVD